MIAPFLKILGVKVPPETVAQIEALIPKLPAKVNELIAANMAAIKNFDERLKALERLQAETLREVIRNGGEQRNGSGIGDPAGTDLRTNRATGN